LKTSCLERYIESCKIRIDNYERVWSFFTTDNWLIKSRFKVYLKKQKQTNEISRRFLHGSKKNSCSTKNRAKKQSNEKWVSASPVDLDVKRKKTIIAFGDGKFSTSMKGCISGTTRWIKSAMKVLADKIPSVAFTEVDEYKTSKVCSSCNEKALENVVDRRSKPKLHAVLKCETCGIVWNRDVNTAKNIYSIFIHQALNNHKKPTVFIKLPTTTKCKWNHAFAYHTVP
jgi:transposase